MIKLTNINFTGKWFVQRHQKQKDPGNCGKQLLDP